MIVILLRMITLIFSMETKWKGYKNNMKQMYDVFT